MAEKGSSHSQLMNKRYSMKGGNYSKKTTFADFSKPLSDYFAAFLNFRVEMRNAGYDV